MSDVQLKSYQKDDQAQEFFFYAERRIRYLGYLAKFMQGHVDDYVQELEEGFDRTQIPRPLTMSELKLMVFSEQRDLATRAIVLMAYAVLEYSLDGIADRLGQVADAGITLEDIKGRGYGLARASTYLRTYVRLNVKKVRNWSELELWGKVRNGIAHGGGRVRAGARTVSVIRSVLEIPIDDDGHIGEIKFDQCQGLMRCIAGFFNSFAAELGYYPSRLLESVDKSPYKSLTDAIEPVMSAISEEMARRRG